jgi:hypothetical protein
MPFVNDQSFTAENMTVDELVQQLHRPILLSVAEIQTAGLSYNIFFVAVVDIPTTEAHVADLIKQTNLNSVHRLIITATLVASST